MAISWTLVVLGTLLQGMQCNVNDNSTTASNGITLPTKVDATTADSTKATVPLITESSTKPSTSSASLESATLTTTLISLEPNKSVTPPAPSESATLTTTLISLESNKSVTTPAPSESSTLATTLISLEPNKSVTTPAPSESSTLATTLASSEPTKPGTPSSSPESTAPPTTKATSPDPTEPSSTVANQYPASTPLTHNNLVTTQITTIQPTTPNTGTTHTAFNKSPQNSPTTVIPTDPNQVTTNLNKPATTISTKDGTTQLLSTQTNPSDVTKNSALPISPDSKSTASQSLGTTKAQTSTASTVPGRRNDEDITTSTSTPQKPFTHSYDLSSSTEENIVRQACKTLGQKMTGNCSVTVEIHGKRLIATVTIDADQTIPPENYKPASGVTDKNTLQKEDVNKDTIPDTLIAILASCGALVLILCCFAAYCTYHRRSYRKNQQNLTEELQTVENGYHDNPTLEVMEVQPEMQEKKLTMNGEFNDSWIVPLDNLLKEDITDEEDTHL